MLVRTSNTSTETAYVKLIFTKFACSMPYWRLLSQPAPFISVCTGHKLYNYMLRQTSILANLCTRFTPCARIQSNVIKLHNIKQTWSSRRKFGPKLKHHWRHWTDWPKWTTDASPWHWNTARVLTGYFTRQKVTCSRISFGNYWSGPLKAGCHSRLPALSTGGHLHLTT